MSTPHYIQSGVHLKLLAGILGCEGNPKICKPKFRTRIRNPEQETRIQNSESGIHKSKNTSSPKTQKLFSIAFACKKNKSSNKRRVFEI